jgi:RHS repeat-associated protein
MLVRSPFDTFSCRLKPRRESWLLCGVAFIAAAFLALPAHAQDPDGTCKPPPVPCGACEIEKPCDGGDHLTAWCDIDGTANRLCSSGNQCTVGADRCDGINPACLPGAQTVTCPSGPTISGSVCQPNSGLCLTQCKCGWSGGGLNNAACNAVQPNAAIAILIASGATTGSVTVTAGDAVSLSVAAESCAATTGSGYHFTWAPAAAIASGQGQMSANFNTGSAGTTTVTATIGTPAGLSNSQSASITVVSPPNTQLQGTPPTFAVLGHPFTLQIGAQGSTSVVTWTVNGVPFTGPSLSFTPVNLDDLHIGWTVTNIAGRQANGAGLVLPVNLVPDGTISGPGRVNANSMGNSASVSAGPADYHYQWSITGDGYEITGGAYQPAVTYTAGVGPGTLSVLVTGRGGLTGSGTLNLNTVSPPDPGSLNPPLWVISGQPFTVPTEQTGVTYHWLIRDLEGVTHAFLDGTEDSATPSIVATLAPGVIESFIELSALVTNEVGTVTQTFEYEIDVSLPPVASITAPRMVSANARALTASVLEQFGAYAWTITGGTIRGPADQSVVTFDGPSSGDITLSVTVTHFAGVLTATDSVVIGTSPYPNCDITAPAMVRAGTAGLVASTPSLTGIHYLWSVTGGTITSANNGNQIAFSAGAGPSMSLTCLTTNDANDTGGQTKTITVVPAPNATITVPSPVAEGTLFGVSVPFQPGSTYHWTLGGTVASAIAAGADTSAPTLLVFPNGGRLDDQVTVGVTVTNALGDSAIGSVTIQMGASLIESINAPTAVTAFATGLTASAAPIAGATYSWTIAGGTITASSGNAITFTAGAAGTLSLGVSVTTGSGGGGGGGGAASIPSGPARPAAGLDPRAVPPPVSPKGITASGSTQVLVVSVPQTPAIGGSTQVVSGTDGWTATVPSNPGMSYLWSVTGGNITSQGGAKGAFGTGTNSIRYSATGAPGTNVQITCTEINGAGAASTAGSKSVAIWSAPATPTITVAAPLTSGATNIFASVPARSGMSYEWTVQGADITSSGGQGGQLAGGVNRIGFTVDAPAGGAITLSCIELLPFGTGSLVSDPETVTVGVEAGVAPPAITMPATVTAGSSGYVAFVTAKPGMTYSWALNGAFLTDSVGALGETTDGRNQIRFMVPPQASGSVVATCVEQNKAGAISAQATASSPIIAAPQPPRVTAPSLVDPGATSLTATVAAHPGMTYQWSIAANSNSAGAAIAGSTAGVTSGSLNTVTFNAGAGGSLILECVEINQAGEHSSPGASSPVVVGMPAVADATGGVTVDPSASQPMVGTMPGSAATEGGAAGYHLPIEVPPGRNGMQPVISLDYNSRNGNGAAGVGWAVSAAGTITRCQRIPDIDGVGKAVLHGPSDALCMGGERLVLQAGSAGYGQNGSVYRHEIEQYDRIELTGSYLNYDSTFVVKHRSGRRSTYASLAQFIITNVHTPDIWYQTAEFDPQGNCMKFDYQLGEHRPFNPALTSNPNPDGSVDYETVLQQITYSGSWSAGAPNTCTADANARKVVFNYDVGTRPDIRTTYQYGVPHTMALRLKSIVTSAPGLSTTVPARFASDGSTVRTYSLQYRISEATGRSLLQQVQACAPDCSITGLKLTPTVFNYQSAQPTYQFAKMAVNLSSSPGTPTVLDNSWEILQTADYDGDGTSDLILIQNKITPYLYLSLSAVALPLNINYGSFQPLAGNIHAFNANAYTQNGKALVMGISGGHLAFAPIRTDFDSDHKPVSATLVTTVDPFGGEGLILTGYTVPASEADSVGFADYDGDGIPDYGSGGCATSSGSQPCIRFGDPATLRGLPGQWQVSGVTAIPFNIPLGEANGDFNGDGTTDIRYDENRSLNHQISSISFLTPSGAAQGPLTFTLPANTDTLGGPVGSAADVPSRQWIDVNGDGLPDIFEGVGFQDANGVFHQEAHLYINMGGPGPSPMFRQVTLHMPATIPGGSAGLAYGIDAAPEYLAGRTSIANTLVMDFDHDGSQELLVPYVRAISYCSGPPPDPNSANHPTPPDSWFCGTDFDPPVDGQALFGTLDQSVFSWNVYKFIEAADGSYTLALQPYSPRSGFDNGFLAPLPKHNHTLAVGDVTGDGMNDATFVMKGDANPNATFEGEPFGVHISFSKQTAPDLMTSASNGLGDSENWTYRPLKYSPLATGLGAVSAPAGTCNPGDDFYRLSAGRTANTVAGLPPDTTRNSPGYAFFTSAMWTVSESSTSSGLRNADASSIRNTTCYSYWDAMMSTLGRGFQGFHFITAEERFGATNGENQNRILTGAFHQEFPLVGRPKMLTVQRSSDGAVLRQSETWWHQTPSTDAPGSWVIYSAGTVETSNDSAAGAPLLSRKTTVNENNPTSGNLVRQCSLLEQGTVGPADGTVPAGPRDVTTLQENQYVPVNPDTSATWLLGDLTTHTVRTGTTPSFGPNNPLLNMVFFSPSCPRVTGTQEPHSVTALCATAAPKCTDAVAGTAPTGSAPTGGFTPPPASSQLQSSTQQWDQTRRLVTSKTTFMAGVQQKVTAFAYDGFGNVTSTDVSGADACPGRTCAASSHAVTVLGYDDPHYFATTKTDPLNRVSTFSFAHETGAPLCMQEVASQGDQGCISYDALGRQTEVKSMLAAPNHPLEIRLAPCFSLACVYKAVAQQNGAPTTAVYYNELNQPVAQGAEGFDGHEVITGTVYNLRGQKLTEYPPLATTATTGQWSGSFDTRYPTSHVFDILGRETQRTVVRDVSLFMPGQGDRVLVTDYVHSVTPSGVQTEIKAHRTSSQGGILDMFRTYDRGGHLVSTTQTNAGHPITAQYFYNASGSVVQVVDPMGSSINVKYDDFGRKLEVQDPDKGTSHYSWDGLNRLRTETDANAIMSTYAYDDAGHKINRFVNTTPDPNQPISTWTYTGSLGTLDSVSGLDNFRRDYKYDAFLRPIQIKTHVPAEDWAAHDFTLQYAYDGSFGRMKAISYPSGETVRLDFDSQRQAFPIGETEITATGPGKVYRRVLGMSPHGAPTVAQLGNGVNEVTAYDDSTGLPEMMSVSYTGFAQSPFQRCAQAPGTLVRCLEMQYDQFRNLATQRKFMLPLGGAPGATPNNVAESYQYDDLQRLTEESRFYTGIVPGSQLGEHYEYDDAGNITKKSDFGSVYTYGNADHHPSGAGPHAVLSVDNTWHYVYDSNGNMLRDGQRTTTYDDQDRPEQIAMNGVTTVFRYTPDGERYLQRITGQSPSSDSINRTIYYVGKEYERIDWDHQASEERTYCGPSVVVESKDGGQRKVHYLHVDRLGSSDAVTDENGVEIEAHGFDAFGRPRGRDWQPSNDLFNQDESGATTNRGFTGHEQLDETMLTHMNGRVYDYRLGRFLSVDPIIGDKADSQSINPYSYGGNNPLSGTDPTGYKYETQLANQGLMTDCRMQACTGVQQQPDGLNVTDVGGGKVLGWSMSISNGAAPAATDKPTNANPADQATPTTVGQNQEGVNGNEDGERHRESGGLDDAIHKAVSKDRKTPETSLTKQIIKAGIEAALRINPQSIRENAEYAGLMYYDPMTGLVGATKAYTRGSGNVSVANDALGDVPENALVVGDYHTHGDYSFGFHRWDTHELMLMRTFAEFDNMHSDEFSPTDKGDIVKEVNAHPGPLGYRGIVATPSGKTLMIDTPDGVPREVR